MIREPDGWPQPELNFDVMSDEEVKEAWRNLYREALDAAERLTKFPPGSPKHIMQKPTREYWKAVERALSAHVFLLRINITPEPTAVVLLNSFCVLAGTLAAGMVPKPLLFAASAGSASPSLRARDNIAHGIAYVLAAKAGWINDKAPVKKVAARFNVSQATIRNWVKRSAAYPPMKAIPTDADYVISRMEYHGEKYVLSERDKSGGRKPAL